MVQFLADQRRGSRLGIAITNPFSALTTYKISAIDMNGRLLHVSYANIAPGSAFTRFIDEFAALPADFSGPVLIEGGFGAEVYASGLKFTGDTFTAIPAMVRIR
jgi:hypothetical protein